MANKLTLKITLGFLVVLLLAVGSILTTAIFEDSNNDEINSISVSASQAMLIAEDAVNGKATEVEFTRDNGLLLYSVEVDIDGNEYEVKIDPQSGQVIEIQEEVSTSDQSSMETQISRSQAESIAQARVGGEVEEVEVQKINDKFYYQIEVKSADTEYEVWIDVQSGNIVKIEEEISETVNSNPTISKLDAIKIAEAAVDGDLEEVEQGRYNGRDVWEIEFEDGNDEIEVIVDMATGAILDIEYEEDD